MSKNRWDWATEGLNPYQTRLHALKTECGCTSGMIALMLALPASLYYFIYAAGTDFSTRQKILYIFLSTFGTSALGKGFWIGIARIRYHALRKKDGGNRVCRPAGP